MTANRRVFLKSSVFGLGALALSAKVNAQAEQRLPTMPPLKWDRTEEVVIVGAGGGGLIEIPRN